MFGLPESLALASGRIDVWVFDLQAFAPELDALRGLLAPDEAGRATAFRFERDRDAFVTRRGLLRCLLGAYLGQPPRALTFTTVGNGKPLLAGSPPPLHFNASHSRGIALLAVSRDGALGIDVERPGTDRDLVAIGERFFAPPEAAALRASPAERQSELFFRIWTRKEAYVKALATGLSLSTRGFEAPLAEAGGAIVDAGRPTGWWAHPLDLPGGCAGALAVRDAAPNIELHIYAPSG